MGWAAGPLGAAQAADREIARQTAVRARAVAAFAATRPASADRRPGQPGCMSAARRAARPQVLAEVSEWAVAELMVALSLSAGAAEALLVRSLVLVHRLPGTLAALEAGVLHAGQLPPLLDHLAPITDDARRAAVEAELLAWIGRRHTVTTPAQLRDKARRLVLARDARAALAGLTAALAERGVWLRSDAVAGMATFGAYLTAAEAQAARDALDRYLDALPADPGDRRTRGQKLADVLLDLILRPGSTSLPPVQAQLTLIAAVPTLLGGDQPAELGGEVVPAELARALARGLGLLPDPEPQPQPDPQPEPTEPAPEPVGPVSRSAAGPARAVEHLLPPPIGEVQPPVGAAEPPPVWAMAEPPPIPDEVLRAWAREGEAELAAIRRAGLPPPTWFPRLYDSPTGPADDPPATGPARPGGGWWAQADAAIEHAGTDLLALQQSIGHAQRLLHTAETAATADETGHQHAAAGRLTAATDALTALAAATTEQRALLGRLLRRSAGGGLADRPRIAVVDALTGALLTLTDSRQLLHAARCDRPGCRRRPDRCRHDLTGRPGLTRPGPSPGYTPATDLDRHLRARDRRCRFPGCRRPVPTRGELDHNRPHPTGPTAAHNLTGYCTPDHRGKHQAPGWTHTLAPDGTLTVTTPTGLTATTTPPPY